MKVNDLNYVIYFLQRDRTIMEIASEIIMRGNASVYLVLR